MSEGDVVLVTGVAGFVGSAVARVLARDGMAVRGLVRRHSTDAAGSAPRINLVDFPGELVEGDARDPVAVARAVAGVRYIVHVAADYRLWAPDASEIERNNLAMTTVMMDAAAAADAERIVYTSSVATLRPMARGVADETRPATVEQAVGVYKKSKVAAERLVEQRAAGGLPVVIVNPSTPVGPRDARPTPTGRIIVEAANGRIPAFVDSGLNLVHVDDVARGHLLALRRGRVGERYVLGGDDVTLGTMLAAIAVRVGRRPPRVRLPRTPLLALAWANETLARRTGRTPFLTRDAIRMAAHHMYFSSAKAHAELGYRARPWQAALDEALAWFEAQAMIAPRSARVRR